MADAAATSDLPPGSLDDRSWVPIFAVCISLMVATILVGMRIWTRKVIINQMGIDDWGAIITLLITWGDGIAIACMTKYGLGKHAAVLDPAVVPLYFRNFWVTIVLYTAGLLSVKLTFLFQYYRVLAVQKLQTLYIVAIVIVGAWGLSQLLIGLLLCRPVQGFWDPTVEAECIPQYPQFYINAAGNIVTDVAVFVLPLPVIGHLNLARQQKFLLLGIFSLGFFTVAISIIRIKFLGQQVDFSWENVDSSAWSIGELCSAVTCACLPTLRPLLSRYFPSLGTHVHHSAGYYHRTAGSSSAAPGTHAHTVDLESQPPRPMHTAASTESKDYLYDDKHPRFELQHQDSSASGDQSEGPVVVGLGSIREGVDPGASNSSPQSPYPTSSERAPAGSSRAVSEEHIIGLRPTVRTEIGPTAAEPSRMAGSKSIQVQTDVYQTKTRGA